MEENDQGASRGLLRDAAKGFLLFRLFAWVGGQSSWRRILVASALTSFVCFFAFEVSSFEGTLRLRVIGGRGLLEHPGTWSLLTTCPVIILMLLNILEQTEKSLIQTTRSTTSEVVVRRLRLRHERLSEILRCSTAQHRSSFYFLVILGLFASIVNLQNTTNPGITYGHEVWDSSTYPMSYVFGRLLVSSQFMYLYPVAIYTSAAVWFSILSLSWTLSGSKTLTISPYHPDKCGGLRHLGNAAMAVCQLSLPFVLIVVGHYYTHHRFYESLVIAGSLVLFGTAAILYLPFVEVHHNLKTAKRALLVDFQNLLETETRGFLSERKALPDSKTNGRQLSILAATALYGQVEKLHTWPYAGLDYFKLISLVSSPLIGFLLKKLFG